MPLSGAQWYTRLEVELRVGNLFQLVILQRSQDVNNAKHIRAYTVLNQLLELWRI